MCALLYCNYTMPDEHICTYGNMDFGPKFQGLRPDMEQSQVMSPQPLGIPLQPICSPLSCIAPITRTSTQATNVSLRMWHKTALLWSGSATPTETMMKPSSRGRKSSNVYCDVW